MRARVVVPVLPQCGHFEQSGARKYDRSGACTGREFVQCPRPGTVAILDVHDQVCGEFCPEHGEPVLRQLVEFDRLVEDGPDRWRAVPIVRGNPRTGVPDGLPS